MTCSPRRRARTGAFAKLDTIKEHIVFWTEGAQAPQLLADEGSRDGDRL